MIGTEARMSTTAGQDIVWAGPGCWQRSVNRVIPSVLVVVKLSSYLICFLCSSFLLSWCFIDENDMFQWLKNDVTVFVQVMAKLIFIRLGWMRISFRNCILGGNEMSDDARPLLATVYQCKWRFNWLGNSVPSLLDKRERKFIPFIPSGYFEMVIYNHQDRKNKTKMPPGR